MPDTKKYTFDNLEFIAMLAHDMKTPVKAQIRAMNLLYSGVLGEFSKEACNIILNTIASNKYMQTLLDNVLNNYRMNNKALILYPQKNDLRKTLEDALCNIGILSEVKNQTVCVNYLCKDFMKFYDEIEIQRVIINLLSNAFEYGSENSKITICLENMNDAVKFSVKSFSSAQNKIKTGTGLGLVICKQIIELHAGKFSAEIDKNNQYNAYFILP